MDAVPTPTINDTIWVTSRVRMISERKALRNQNISFLAVTYYSLFTVILSVFDEVYSTPYPLLDEITLSSSIIVLVASLVAAGFRLEARASTFRECYLKLQTLHDEELSEQEKKMKYREILVDFPNHTPSDYCDFLTTHIFIERKKLWSGGRMLECTTPMKVSYLTRISLYCVFVSVLFLAPIFFLLRPFVC